MTDWKEEILQKWTAKQEKTNFITDGVRDRLAREFKGEVCYREPMSLHTTIRIGGSADAFLKPAHLEDLKKAVSIARQEDIPFLFHGWGSNTLVKDGGIRGFVICPATALKACKIVSETEEHADVLAEAGYGITSFVNFCRDHGLTGCEALAGIPGSMGGAIMMNAGARGTEIKDIVREITVIEADGNVKNLPREKLEFSYRNLKLPRSTCVLSGLFRLEKGKAVRIAEKIREYQKKRAESQPLNFPNLGSIFKNPKPSSREDPYAAAGALIEESGLKNIRVGGARVSEKHANFIVNEKDASAKDVLVLINLVKDKVKEKTGVLLETEIKIVGEDAG